MHQKMSFNCLMPIPTFECEVKFWAIQGEGTRGKGMKIQSQQRLPSALEKYKPVIHFKIY